MGPWAAAGAARSATTAARMSRAIDADVRIAHRLRRVRNSPAPTAAIAPTTTARSCRFSGAAGVMSGPLTVGPGDARTGSCRRNDVDAETAIESGRGRVEGDGQHPHARDVDLDVGTPEVRAVRVRGRDDLDRAVVHEGVRRTLDRHLDRRAAHRVAEAQRE